MGRGALLETIQEALLEREAVVLAGPPGVGKTRLAVELGERLGGLYCDLREARTMHDVEKALAVVLGLDTIRTGPSALSRLRRALTARGSALLVLDDVDRVVEELREVLRAWRGSGLRVLCTSRRKLELERGFAVCVPPLAVPTDGETDPGVLRASEAIVLFLDQAARRAPGLAFDEPALASVARIVRRLDGLPLAIQLAAARMSTLSTLQLESLLSQRFELLELPSEELRALSATISWSWNALSEEARRAMMYASVFRGGFDIEALSRVLERPAVRTLALLEELEEHSLLQVGRRGALVEPPRYSMLESIQEYARQELVAKGREPEVRDRHAAWCAELAGRLCAGLYEAPADTASSLPQWRAELANMHFAIDWALSATASVTTMEHASQMLRALSVSSWTSPRAVLLPEQMSGLEERARSIESDAETLLRIRVFAVRQKLRSDRGGEVLLQEVEALRDDAIAIATPHLEAFAERMLAEWHGRRGGTDDDCAHGERAVQILDEIGDDAFCAIACVEVGMAYKEARLFDQATRWYERGLTAARRLGSPWTEAFALGELGAMALEMRRWSAAQHDLEAALSIQASLHNPTFESYSWGCLGHVHHDSGDLAAARAVYDRALAVAEANGDWTFAGMIKGYRALLGLEEGRFGDAAQDAREASRQTSESGFHNYQALFEAVREAAEAAEGLDHERGRTLGWPRRHGEAEPDAVEVTLIRSWAGLAPPLSDAALERLADLRDPTCRASRRFEMRCALRLLGALPCDGQERTALQVSTKGHWFRLAAQRRVELAGRPNLFRIVEHLARARAKLADPATVAELVAVGWPGEKVGVKSGRDRVYVAMSSLRKLGLKPLIERVSEGYHLRDHVEVTFVD